MKKRLFKNLSVILTSVILVGTMSIQAFAATGQLEGWNKEEHVKKWGSTSTAITALKTSWSSDVKQEGEGSLLYEWQNETYSWQWSEIYLDVGEYVQANKDSGLTGLSLWLNNTEEREIGKVGFWIKFALADGSEFEADYDKIQNGTALDFTGWREVIVPFTALKAATYNANPNKEFEATELKYVKIGTWGDKSVTMYIDDLQLIAANPLKELASEPLEEQVVEDDKALTENMQQKNDDTSTEQTQPDNTTNISPIFIGVVVLLIGVTGAGIVLYFNKKKKN